MNPRCLAAPSKVPYAIQYLIPCFCARRSKMRSIRVITSCDCRLRNFEQLRISGHWSVSLIKSHLPPSSVYNMGHISPHSNETSQCFAVRLIWLGGSTHNVLSIFFFGKTAVESIWETTVTSIYVAIARPNKKITLRFLVWNILRNATWKRARVRAD